MSEKYLVIYKLDRAELTEDAEAFIFEGTEKEAIETATGDKRHWNYGRHGVQIYKIDEPVFEKFERD